MLVELTSSSDSCTSRTGSDITLHTSLQAAQLINTTRSSHLRRRASHIQVWEVVAQLIGLALSVALLNGIDATGDPTNAVWSWGAIQSVHVALRYKSLSVIQLPSLNQKRSCALVNAHLQGQQLPGKPVAFSLVLMCLWCMHACLARFSRVLQVASKEPCHLLWAAACISMFESAVCVCLTYKSCSEAAVTGNVRHRQVQLEQGFALCIAMLETLQLQSLAMPELSDCDRS